MNTQPTKPGILLIALGSPQYGRYAANLAASIRWNDPDLPIHLVHTEESISHLTAQHMALFTSHAICPPEAYLHSSPLRRRGAGPAYRTGRGEVQFIRAKTWMYDLSPFDETLFLDVDTLILPHNSLTKFIAQLSSLCDFTIENRGYADMASPKSLKDYSVWCDVDALRQHYMNDPSSALRKDPKDRRYYNLHSELVFFKKTKKNKAFFDKVNEVYDHPPVVAAKFDTGLPDEFAFSVAMMLLRHYPHQDHYVRIYWQLMENKHDWYSHVTKNFIGFSLGGNVVSPNIRARVKAYTNLFRQSLRLPYLFTIHHKKQWNKNREKV